MLTSKWHLWLGIAVSIVLLLFLAYQVYRIDDPSGLIDELAEANYVYLVPAVAVYFVGVLFRALRWQFLLNPMRRFPLKRLYPVVVIGYAANNLLPMRLGELVRSYYLARQENFSASSALGSVAVERVFDGLTLIALVAVTAPWLLLLGEFDWTAGVSQTTATALAVIVVLVFGGFLTVFTLLAVWRGFSDLVERLLALLPGKLGALALRSSCPSPPLWASSIHHVSTWRWSRCRYPSGSVNSSSISSFHTRSILAPTSIRLGSIS